MSRRNPGHREAPPLPTRDKLLGRPSASPAPTPRPAREDPERNPRPEVARALAELALSHRGDYRAPMGRLRVDLADRLGADHPAARTVISAKRACKAARPLLTEFGLAFTVGADYARVYLVVNRPTN